MRIRWLRTALKNLEEIAPVVAADQPRAAAEMTAEIMARVGMLEDFPAAGRPGRVMGSREIVMDRYPILIPYRVVYAEVHILRVFHTRQLPPVSW